MPSRRAPRSRKRIEKASDDPRGRRRVVQQDQRGAQGDQGRRDQARRVAGPAWRAQARHRPGRTSATSPRRRTRPGGLRTANALLSAERSGDLLDRLGTLDQMPASGSAQITGYTDDHAATTLDREAAAGQGHSAKQAAQVRELAARKKKIEADLKKLYEMRRRRTARRPNRHAGTPARSRRCPARPASPCGSPTARSACRTSGRPTGPTATTAPG